MKDNIMEQAAPEHVSLIEKIYTFGCLDIEEAGRDFLKKEGSGMKPMELCTKMYDDAESLYRHSEIYLKKSCLEVRNVCWYCEHFLI